MDEFDRGFEEIGRELATDGSGYGPLTPPRVVTPSRTFTPTRYTSIQNNGSTNLVIPGPSLAVRLHYNKQAQDIALGTHPMYPVSRDCGATSAGRLNRAIADLVGLELEARMTNGSIEAQEYVFSIAQRREVYELVRDTLYIDTSDTVEVLTDDTQRNLEVQQRSFQLRPGSELTNDTERLCKILERLNDNYGEMIAQDTFGEDDLELLDRIDEVRSFYRNALARVAVDLTKYAVFIPSVEETLRGYQQEFSELLMREYRELQSGNREWARLFHNARSQLRVKMLELESVYSS